MFLREKSQKSTSIGLLSDQLILEIGGNVSGPTATAELARAGARVIKVEFDKGDPARIYLSPEIFAQFNAGKQSILVNKNSPEYSALLSQATVIIDNRSPGAKNRDDLLQKFLSSPSKKHPVIFCSLVGYDRMNMLSVAP